MNRSYGNYGQWGNVTTTMSPGATISTPNEDGFDAGGAASAGGQVVSGLAARGATSSKKGVRGLSAAGKTVGGGAGIVGTAATLGLPLNAVPVAGQIAFAAVVVGAATVAFIVAMRSGRKSNAKIDKLAKKEGLTEDLKHYTRKVLRMSKAKRKIELAKEKKRFKKKKKGGLHALGRSKKRLTEKLDIIQQVVNFDKAEAEATAKAKAAGASDAEITASTSAHAQGAVMATFDSVGQAIGISGKATLGLGLGLAGLILFLIFRRKNASS